MERGEAIAILRELIKNGLAQPSLVNLREKTPGQFELVLKDECDTQAITQFVSEKNLVLISDTKKSYVVICKK